MIASIRIPDFIETKIEVEHIEVFLSELINLTNSFTNNNNLKMNNPEFDQTLKTFLHNAILLKEKLMKEISSFNTKN